MVRRHVAGSVPRSVGLSALRASGNPRRGTAPDSLDQLPSGLWNYYTRNLQALRDDNRQWDAFYLPLLATLTAAQEPLTPAMLAAMAGISGLGSEVRRFLNGWWRPFCATIGERYILYHQSLREYLAGMDPVATADSPEFAGSDRSELSQAVRAAHHRIADRYLAAWGNISDGLPALCDDEKAAFLDHGYGLRHLPAHLEAAARESDVHARACEQPTQTPSGMCNTWYRAHDRAGTTDT